LTINKNQIQQLHSRRILVQPALSVSWILLERYCQWL